MYVPAARERVRVDGHPGAFFVLTVNLEAATADLMALDGPIYLLEAVSVSYLRPLNREPEADSS